MRFSKRVLQENKASKMFQKTNISWGRKCSFFGKFGVLCFLVTPVLKFAILPYSRQSSSHCPRKQKTDHLTHFRSIFPFKQRRTVAWNMSKVKHRTKSFLVSLTSCCCFSINFDIVKIHESRQSKHLIEGGKYFRVNNKNTWTALLRSFWWLYY